MSIGNIRNFVTTKTTGYCKYDANEIHKLKILLVTVNKKRISFAPPAATKQHTIWVNDTNFFNN
jgi:hypothetical protein